MPKCDFNKEHLFLRTTLDGCFCNLQVAFLFLSFRRGWIDLHFSEVGIISPDINMETRALIKLKKDLYAILDIGKCFLNFQK